VSTHTVLDGITPPAQSIILQIEQLKPGVYVFDELANLEWSTVIAKRNRIWG
jgi:hypothetical protein